MVYIVDVIPLEMPYPLDFPDHTESDSIHSCPMSNDTVRNSISHGFWIKPHILQVWHGLELRHNIFRIA